VTGPIAVVEVTRPPRPGATVEVFGSPEPPLPGTPGTWISLARIALSPSAPAAYLVPIDLDCAEIRCAVAGDPDTEVSVEIRPATEFAHAPSTVGAEGSSADPERLDPAGNRS